MAALRGALVINAVVLAEIAPRFSRIEMLEQTLPSMAVTESIPFTASFLAGHAHANYRRAGGARQAILPDFLIGAHAAVTGRPLQVHTRRMPRQVHTRRPSVIRRSNGELAPGFATIEDGGRCLDGSGP